MRLSGSLPVAGRRVVIALGIAGMLLVPSAVFAQDAAAAQPEPPDAFKFTSATPVMVVWSVNQGQEASFEMAFNEMKAGLIAAEKADFQAQGRSLQLMKVDAPPAAGQPVLYLLFLDPPVVNLSYNITQILYYGGAFSVEGDARKKVDDLYAKFNAALASQAIWPIQKK